MNISIRWWVFLLAGCYFFGVLTILPLPEALKWYRPQWLLLFVIFCQVTNPNAFNPVVAWLIGLLADSLLGTRLGEHALVFSLIAYVTWLLRARFVQHMLWQQLGKVFLLVCLAQIFILWFHALNGENPHTLLYWAGALTSAVCWPLLVVILQALCGLRPKTFASTRLG